MGKTKIFSNWLSTKVGRRTSATGGFCVWASPYLCDDGDLGTTFSFQSDSGPSHHLASFPNLLPFRVWKHEVNFHALPRAIAHTQTHISTPLFSFKAHNSVALSFHQDSHFSSPGQQTTSIFSYIPHLQEFSLQGQNQNAPCNSRSMHSNNQISRVFDQSPSFCQGHPLRAAQSLWGRKGWSLATETLTRPRAPIILHFLPCPLFI